MRRVGPDQAPGVNFLAELKRRNVIRVAVFYGVASWLVLQVADLLFDIIGVPGWSLRLVLGILLLGFPLALIFSWIYELTPDGLKRESELDPAAGPSAPTAHRLNVATVVVVLIGIVVVAADRLLPGAGDGTASTPPALAAEATPNADSRTAEPVAAEPAALPSIAVLPFENFSGQEEDEYFSDGLADTVLHQLAQVRGLRVIARNSTFQFKGTNLDVREIGQRLGVTNVLEGSVQRYGDQVRVIAQLVRAADGAHIWSESFDYAFDDIFALHDAIAAAVTSQMKVALLPEDRARLALGGTENPAAYDLAMLAIAEHNKRFSPSMVERLASDEAYLPLQLLRRALSLDPDYVDAMLGIAGIYNSLAWQTSNPERYRDYLDKGERMVDRAIELAPGYSAAWAEKGSFERRRGKADAGIRALERAISLNANDADAHGVLAVAHLPGNPEAAIHHMDRKQALDPETRFFRPKVIALSLLGRVDEAVDLAKSTLVGEAWDEMTLADLAEMELWARGRPDEAARWAGRLLASQPDSLRGAEVMASAWMAAGDLERARAWLPRIEAGRTESRDVMFFRISLRLRSGDSAGARALLAETPVVEESSWRRELEAVLCVLDDDFECAATALERAAEITAAEGAAGEATHSARLQQDLLGAAIAAHTGNDAGPLARAVLEDLRELPRTSWGGPRIEFRDAEAYVLLGDIGGALEALEATLLPDGGIVPYDSFRTLADEGFVLSRLDGEPRYEDWKARFRARRAALRDRMIRMEAAGEIPRA